MTIKRQHIENYQSHEETDLEFHSGVNVIIGPTDGGKSAILRDLNLIIQNAPSGVNFISKWAKEIFTSIDLEEGIKVSRTRNKSGTKNIYEISTYKDPLEGFGQGDPPEEVTSILNLSDINIQSQLEGHFLLNKNPGDVAKRLNSAVNLEKISFTQEKITSMVKKVKKEKNICDSDLKVKSKQILKYEWVSKAERQLLELESLEKDIKQKDQKLDDIDDLLNKIEKEEENIKVFENVAGHLDKVNEYIDLYNDVHMRTIRLRELKILIANIREEDNVIETNDPISKCLPEIEKLIELLTQIKGRNQKLDDIDDLLNKIEKEETEIGINEKKARDYKNKFDKLMPETCILCEQIVEKWKDIPDYEGIYQVSNLGRVRSYYGKDQKKTLTDISTIKAQSLDKDGYKRVNLYKDGKQKNISVHRLVLEVFIGPCPDGKEGSHLDDDKSNNRLENLLWETHEENVNRREYSKGEDHWAYGKELSEEVKRKISESHKGKGIGEENPFYGKKHTEESKLKMSKSHKRTRGNKNGKR